MRREPNGVYAAAVDHEGEAVEEHDTPVAPALEHEFTLQVATGPTVVAGAGPNGMRLCIPLTGGTVAGSRINGTVVGPAGDWATVDRGGLCRIDVRLQVVTDDEATVYVHSAGLIQITPEFQAALGSADLETAFGDQYFRVVQRFETGAKQYDWLHQHLFVGRGRATRSGVEYEVFRVV